MGLLDKIIGNAINNVTASASRQIGDAIGNAAGNALSNVANEATESMTLDLQRANEAKRLANEKEVQAKRHEMEDLEKIQNLPEKCPHCKAPTTKKIVCEYCDCKVVV